MYLVIFVVAGYLIGSVSSAVVVSRILGYSDPRSSGSGNPGATNVLRLSGKKAAALTLIGDLLKGTIPVVTADLVVNDPLVTAATAVAAVLGHIYPIFFGFKGGKGVATAIGVYLGINLFLGFGISACWLIVAGVTRFASASSISAMLSAPVFAWGLGFEFPVVLASAILFVLIAYSHKDNISRLLAGEESKINLKR